MQAKPSARINLHGIIWFVAIAYGLAWLLDLPVALSGKGLASPWGALVTLQNFTPAVATFLVARWISPVPSMRRATGLRWGARGSQRGWYWLFGLLGLSAFNIAAPFVGSLFEVFPLDLAHFSGLRALLANSLGVSQPQTDAPLHTIALVIVATLPLQALLIPRSTSERNGVGVATCYPNVDRWHGARRDDWSHRLDLASPVHRRAGAHTSPASAQPS